MRPELLRVLIADDERLARGLLRRYAASDAGLTLVRECATTHEVAASLSREEADLAGLDVQMPGPDIFDVLADTAASHALPAIIFSTAFDVYAVRAFDLNAVDYLVK